MRIDIWSDVVCPWCYLGARRLGAALDQVGRDGMEVRWRAFQLDPAAPPEPGDLRSTLDRKYGPGAFDSMTAHLVALGREVGIDYRFDRVMRVNTSRAHRLIAWAGTVGAQDPLVERLFDDYFIRGADLSDAATLRVAAESVGLDGGTVGDVLGSDAFDQQIRADRAEARERGITGVPAFVIDDEWIIPGAQETGRFVQMLSRAR